MYSFCTCSPAKCPDRFGKPVSVYGKEPPLCGKAPGKTDLELFHSAHNGTGAYGVAALTDGETQTG
ncbi:MAG: hypothetical protein CW338_10740, partial [Clostridiales bacterium]|nr:hypothetical protein [Clostridiales bacterium]